MTKHLDPSGWQVQGTAADNYERYLVPAIFATWAPRLLDAAGVRRGQRCLDVACGTGVVARAAAVRAGGTGRVVGLDVNSGMVAAAMAADRACSVEWRQGDATALPFGAGEFDAVLCQQGLQFFPDPVRAVSEMRRVAGDGVVVVAVWAGLRHNPVFAGFAAALDRHAGAAAGDIMRSPFGLGDEDRLRAVFAEAGFSHVDIAIETAEVRFASVERMVHEEAASSPLAEPLAALAPEGWAALVADVARAVAGHQAPRGVVFPIANQIVTARR